MKIINRIKNALRPVSANRGHYLWPSRGEDYPGQWQANIPRRDTGDIVTFPYVWSAVTLIAGDIGKLPLKLMKRGDDGLWAETESPAFSHVLRKPSRHSTRQQWVESVILSVLLHGNAYLLKLFDNRNTVRELRLLSPDRVTVLASDSGEIFYQLQTDNLAGIGSDTVTVPANSIIHFRVNCIFHELIGVSPLRAAAMAAGLGLSIQENATDFFRNSSRVGAILTMPGAVADEDVELIKSRWETKFSGRNGARSVAILADGMTYSPLQSIPAADAQAIETLNWTGTTIAAVFKVPAFKLGLADIKYDQVESLSKIYYSDCLQVYLEHFEALLTAGLNLPGDMAVEFDLDGLLRMSFGAQIATLGDAIGSGIFTINEARRAVGKPAVEGGNLIYRQEQEHPLAELANRLPAAADEPDPEITEDVKRIVSSLNASKLKESIVHK